MGGVPEGARRETIDASQRRGSRFFILGIVAGIVVTGIALTGLFRASEWYAEGVSLPRYCDEPAVHVARVGQILTEPKPAGEGTRRPYIVAAKLLYLIPRGEVESVDAYLARLSQTIRAGCS